MYKSIQRLLQRFPNLRAIPFYEAKKVTKIIFKNCKQVTKLWYGSRSTFNTSS